nr:PREDICTED: prostaglandin E2 receptor EP4 subtype-like [Lepisosteus oculatus]
MVPASKAHAMNATQWDSVFPAASNLSSALPLRLESRAVITSASMFAVGVLGNLVAIVVLCTSKKEQKETTFYTLVCGMAVTDLLGTCCTSPVVIATYVTNRWHGGELLCHFFSFSMLFFGSAGMSILCAMSVERYLAINQAYFYSHYVDRTVARLALVTIYLANVVLCVLPSFGFGKHVRHFPGTWCFLDWRASDLLAASYSFVYGGFMLLLIAVTVACNVAVCGSLVRMSQRARLVRAEGPGKEAARRRFPGLPSVTSAAEIQMFWLLVFMTVVFLVCSIPLVVRIFVNQLYGPAHILAGGMPDYRSDLLAIRLASFNPILDPWVYILCRKNLLSKGCERLRRTVGIAREGHARKEGWMSGQQTPPSYVNSVSTSYASLRTRDERRGYPTQVDARTKSFSDFATQQTWDLDTSRTAFHPFGAQQGGELDCERGGTVRSDPAPAKPILCAVLREPPRPPSSRDGQFEIVTSTFSAPNSSASEKCI